MDEKKRIMILDWMRKIHILEHAHRLESLKWNKLNNWLGVPALLIGALIGLLSSICEINNMILVSVIAAIGGFTVATITGIQTFLKPMKISEKHMNTSSVYEKLRHKIEFILQFKSQDSNIDELIEDIRNEWEQIRSLNVRQSNFDTAKEWIKDMKKYPEELGFLDKIDS